MIRDALRRAALAFRTGQIDRAAAELAPVLAADPEHIDALILSANIDLQREDFDHAIPTLRRLQELRPELEAIRRNLATALNRRGNRADAGNDVRAAQADWRAALEIQPDREDIRLNLADSLRRNQEPAAALSLYRAVPAASDDAGRALAEADCLIQMGDPAAAAARIPEQVPNELRLRAAGLWARAARPERALELLPEDPVQRCDHWLELMGGCVVDGVDTAPLVRAVAAPEVIGTRAPELRLALAGALQLPSVYDSRDHLLATRAGFKAGLDALIESFTPQRLAHCAPGLAQLAWSNFLLAYQGEDDLSLQCRYGDWLAEAARVLAPPWESPPRRAGRARIGLVSGHFYYCTAGSYFGPWLDALAELDADLFLVQHGPRADAYTEELRRRSPNFLLTDAEPDRALQQIRALNLDLAIFPELGMDQRLLPAAAAGLARQQWMAWGHPISSGLPTVSHYLSCADMEPDLASTFYSETLLLLPGIGTRFALPAAPEPRSRAALGLPEGELVIVPQSLFKVLPDNDAVYAELLERRPQARLVFFGAEQNRGSARFRQRLRAAVGTHAERLVFLSEVPRARYLELLAACDLMLDTLHWSGGNSALDAIRAGLPIATSCGRFMRGRQCAAMLRQLGAPEGIAAAPGQLAGHAAGLLADIDLRHHMRSRQINGIESLVNDPRSGRALQAHVMAAIAPN